MNNDIPLFVKDFLDYMKTIKGLSENTVKEYYYDVRLFLKYMVYRLDLINYNAKSVNDIDITSLRVNHLRNITVIDLHSYISYRDTYRNNSSSTRARQVSSLRSFYKYLTVISKQLKENPSLELERPKLKKRNPVYLTLEESKLLLKTINNEKNLFIRTRDFSIVLLFLTTGIRLSELTSMNIKSIKGKEFNVIGKGNKERVVYMTDACKYALDNYLNIRPDIENVDALFLSNRNKRISNRAIQHMMDKYLTKAGFDVNRYSAHKLRHTAATLMFREGIDIRTLQKVLGHESIATTQIYTHVVDDNVRKAIDLNPLKNIDIDIK